MYGCLTSAKYAHTADLLEVQIEQDPISKAIRREWTATETFSCYANSIATDAVSDASSGKRFDADYDEYEVIKLLTTIKLNKRQRVSNIRAANGEVLWVEPGVAQEPTIFEVQGCYLRQDPFGAVIEYEVLLKRTEVQVGQ